MADFRPADHAMGLELQLEEATEQRERAIVQHRPDDAERLDAEIDRLQKELAATAELAAVVPEAAVEPELHYAEELGIDEDPS